MANQNARHLRSNQTEAEMKLWKYLSGKKLGGFRFRRQHPMKQYIVDFACLEERLIVELDGSQHVERQKADASRTAYLESRGFRVIRFWNNEVLENIEGVCGAILKELNAEPGG